MSKFLIFLQLSIDDLLKTHLVNQHNFSSCSAISLYFANWQKVESHHSHLTPTKSSQSKFINKFFFSLFPLLNFSYLIENEICYLVLCDKMFSKRIAFNYLEDLAQEFYSNYGRKINTVTRPYAFIEFDIYIQKAKKSLTDRRRNINTINSQLQDVQRIMVSLSFS